MSQVLYSHIIKVMDKVVDVIKVKIDRLDPIQVLVVGRIFCER